MQEFHAISGNFASNRKFSRLIRNFRPESEIFTTNIYSRGNIEDFEGNVKRFLLKDKNSIDNKTFVNQNCRNLYFDKIYP
jgi:hypothetical protein